MVGVQDCVTCPQCGYDHAFYEFQTRDGTFDIFCEQCGYREWTTAVIDRQKEKATGKPYFKLNEKGKRIYNHYVRKGFGSYRIDGKKGVSQLGYLPKEKKEREELIKKLKLAKDDGMKIKITVADGKNVEEIEKKE